MLTSYYKIYALREVQKMTKAFYEVVYSDRKFFGREGAMHCIRIDTKDLPAKVQELTDKKANIKQITRCAYYTYNY